MHFQKANKSCGLTGVCRRKRADLFPRVWFLTSTADTKPFWLSLTVRRIAQRDGSGTERLVFDTHLLSPLSPRRDRVWAIKQAIALQGLRAQPRRHCVPIMFLAVEKFDAV